MDLSLFIHGLLVYAFPLLYVECVGLYNFIIKCTVTQCTSNKRLHSKLIVVSRFQFNGSYYNEIGCGASHASCIRAAVRKTSRQLIVSRVAFLSSICVLPCLPH